MPIDLPNRSNGTTVLPPAPAAVPAAPALNSSSMSPLAKQATLDKDIPTSPHPRPSASTAVSLANERPSSARSVVLPPTASAPARTTLALSPPPITTPAAISAVNASTGAASTTSVLESNTLETYPDVAPSSGHTSTAILVAIGLSGVGIVLMLMILIRFFVKQSRKKRAAKQQFGGDDNLIVIPSTAFLDHPKNQEIGGVGASPASQMDRSASFRSHMSFKHQHHHHTHTLSNHPVAFRPSSEMEFLHGMGTAVSLPQAWDGSRPSLAHNRSFY
ncbi:hypothetical protein VP01_3143g6 [Puccinia sorghi]|uniref:Uncharacterized protein n=1 Tax=Puccinia sorghi TaxID=27349 RepID=A0A0L6UYX2_9BASI|nr:hypothetical protein VP01_3143g6 [Puccinia sorghi]